MSLNRAIVHSPLQADGIAGAQREETAAPNHRSAHAPQIADCGLRPSLLVGDLVHNAFLVDGPDRGHG